MWNLPVFAVLGFLVGAAARLFYTSRQSMHLLSTLGLGVIGALAGGMFSWLYWPSVDGQFQLGNLLMPALTAAIIIVIGAFVAHKRNLSGVCHPSK
jgi:uncharacterized membrane protein YeaQ/YmgE (transglycosylase-associated protein family)